MSEYPPLPVRVWRARPWNTNPLMRASDRFETIVRILAAAVILAAVPVAGAAGTAAYVADAARIRAENAGKAAALATITGEPKRVAEIAPRSPAMSYRVEAPVRWTQDGRSGTATVEVAAAAGGAQVPIWLGPDASPTGPPRSSSTAVGTGIEAGLALLLGIWGGAMGLVVLTAWALTDHRRACWERQWTQADHQLRQDWQ